MHPALDSFFQPASGGGQRLYLHHTPPAGRPVRGVVVYVHPWAEEMNKSRRMAALASRALAADGWAVLQVDLLGCGDSSGEFVDASWEAWVEDVCTAAHWVQSRHPEIALWLWGLRAGALLANAAAARIASPVNLLFWQPTLQGRTVLQQFLRVKAAAQLADGGGKAILDAARADLAAGRSVEVAGYELSAVLAGGLEAASLTPAEPNTRTLARPAPRMVWLEVSNQAEPALTLANQTALPAWQAAGWITDTRAVAGPPFWQTTEIEDAQTLVEATVALLASELPLQDCGEPTRRMAGVA